MSSRHVWVDPSRRKRELEREREAMRAEDEKRTNRRRIESERAAPLERILERERPILDAMWNPEARAARAIGSADFDDALYSENVRSPPQHDGPLADLLRDRPMGAFALRTTLRRLVDAGDDVLRDSEGGPIRLVSIDIQRSAGVVSCKLVALFPDGTYWDLAIGDDGRHALGKRVASLEALAYEHGGREPVAWRPPERPRRDHEIPPYVAREDVSKFRKTLRLSGGFFRRLPDRDGRVVHRFTVAPWARDGRPSGYKPAPGEIDEYDVYGVAVSFGSSDQHVLYGLRDGTWYEYTKLDGLPDEPDEQAARARSAPYPGDKFSLERVRGVPELVEETRGRIESANRYI